MATPAPNQDENSKMKKILTSSQDESIMARLPRGSGIKPPAPPQPPEAEADVVPTPEPAAQPQSTDTNQPAKTDANNWRSKFLPIFWTVASIMSFTVNIVLLIVVVVLLLNRGSVGTLANDQVNQLLGGLYNNFVLMDQANIQTTIHVEKEIPVQFSLNVSGPTDVTLREAVTIDGALVTVATGGLNIVNARARIVLPEGTVLPINIQNLVVPVDQKVLAVLDVPVDIPLNQTELHQPFVGLQGVVRPWYCLMQPNAVNADNTRVCDGVENPLGPVFELIAP